MSDILSTDVVVIGSGPGGYSAAFRAADLGLKVTLVERYETLGGVCLNVGCIPSKALLHIAKVLDEAEELGQRGIQFSKPNIDREKLHHWVQQDVVNRLTSGLKMMAKQRQVHVVQGVGSFSSPNTLTVKQSDAAQEIQFKNAIIAVGSRVVELPFLPKDPRIIDSTGALQLAQSGDSLLVLGGGIIGMEMATVYHALGTKITIVELQDQLISGADMDIVVPLYKRVSKRYEKILLKTKVTAVEAKADGLWVTFAGDQAPAEPQRFDRILSAVGRRPNGDQIAADKAEVRVDERGFIAVDKQCRTNVPHIFAIGDVVGQPMLAHKAVNEGRVAAEVIAGKQHFFDPRCIPAIAYTDPEVAWVGLTELAAKAQGIEYGKGVFPWAANGRSLSLGRNEGLTKLIIDKASNRVLGVGVVGPGAGDLIAEAALAIEMGCDVEDLALTVHAHPTTAETIAMAAEVFEGTVTDLYLGGKQ